MSSTKNRREAARSGFSHPGAIVGFAGAVLVGSYLVAVQDPLPAWELRFTEWINDAPDAAASLLFPVMQFGTPGGPVVVAIGIAIFKRDWLLSGATITAGLIAWFGAKGVKKLVERDRPLTYLPDIAVREGDGSGLGFVSGHAAVAATAAVMAIVALPRSWMPAAVVAALAGIARIVHGVHLPADVLGGWSFGVLISMGVLAVVDRIDQRRDAPDRAVSPT